MNIVVVLCTNIEHGNQWAVGSFRSKQVAEDFIAEACRVNKNVRMEVLELQTPRTYIHGITP